MSRGNKLRVLAIPKAPFVFYNKRHFKGFLVDLMEQIAKRLGFSYEIILQEDFQYGFMDNEGNWDGVIEELMNGRADVGLAAFGIMSERKRVVDFTEPVYKPTGISVLMRKSRSKTDIFRFATILDLDVWLCIVGSYILTSTLLWVYDVWSPFSYRNNRCKESRKKARIFGLKESLWFCLTSLTPQGGGEAPRNLSGRLVAATWWLFGFIIVASYTANLAAYLTIKKFEKEIETFEDLVSQYRVTFSIVQNSSTHRYFERMSGIEYQLYDKWKEMTLNDSLNVHERAQLAVWDYPLSDKFIKIYSALNLRKMLDNLTEGIDRLRVSGGSKFALITEATDVQYQVIRNCFLREIGPEFSKKSFGLALQKNSPLTKGFNEAILRLQNDGWFDRAIKKWWKETNCEQVDINNGLGMSNMGGLFVLIIIGITIAFMTLIYEFFYYTFSRDRIKQFYERKFKKPIVKGKNKIARIPVKKTLKMLER